MRTPAAVFVSGLIFALYHLHLADLAEGYRAFLSVGMVMKFAFGIFFAIAATRTQSLLPSTIAHGLLWAIMCDN